MTPSPDADAAGLVTPVRAALASGDLDSFAELLHPDVHWGPPDSPGVGCHNRREVLRWYRRGRAAGARATVTEVSAHGDRLLVGLGVRRGAAVEARWQVLTVAGGRIVDIAGYDDRAAAAAAAGASSGGGA